jgi:hypothetical protein
MDATTSSFSVAMEPRELMTALDGSQAVLPAIDMLGSPTVASYTHTG